MRRALTAFQERKVSRGIGLQAGGIAVSGASGEAVASDVLVVVRFAVGIPVVKRRNSVSANHVNSIANALQAQSLVEAGRKTLPDKLLESPIDSVDHRSAAVKRANSWIAIS